MLVDILDAVPITGGLFVRAGSKARVFAFGDRAPLEEGQEFVGEVEYVGGPFAGELQLHRLGARGIGDEPS
jgi:hypothetical protein